MVWPSFLERLSRTLNDYGAARKVGVAHAKGTLPLPARHGMAFFTTILAGGDLPAVERKSDEGPSPAGVFDGHA